MLFFVDQPLMARELPYDAGELKQWFIDVLSPATERSMAAKIREAEVIASQRFPVKLVVFMLREVLSKDLVGHR